MRGWIVEGFGWDRRWCRNWMLIWSLFVLSFYLDGDGFSKIYFWISLNRNLELSLVNLFGLSLLEMFTVGSLCLAKVEFWNV